MRQDLLDTLYKDYPLLFVKKLGMNTEVYVRDGWYPTINILCDILMEHIKDKIPEEAQDQIYISLIKEKFGMMRFHLNHWDDYMMGAITMAEAQTTVICEVCGSPGLLLSVKGWLQTLCDKDFIKAMEKK